MCLLCEGQEEILVRSDKRDWNIPKQIMAEHTVFIAQTYQIAYFVAKGVLILTM